MRKNKTIIKRYFVLIAMGVLLCGCADKQRAEDVKQSTLLIIESEASFDKSVLKAEKPVLVDFWATWCPPCKVMNPIVAEAALTYHDSLDVAKVDLDANKALAQRFSIRAVPTLMIFNQGKLVAAHEGAMGAKALNKWVKKYLNELSNDLSQSST